MESKIDERKKQDREGKSSAEDSSAGRIEKTVKSETINEEARTVKVEVEDKRENEKIGDERDNQNSSLTSLN